MDVTFCRYLSTFLSHLSTFLSHLSTFPLSLSIFLTLSRHKPWAAGCPSDPRGRAPTLATQPCTLPAEHGPAAPLALPCAYRDPLQHRLAQFVRPPIQGCTGTQVFMSGRWGF
eukprot:EG_transcript_22581